MQVTRDLLSRFALNTTSQVDPLDQQTPKKE